MTEIIYMTSGPDGLIRLILVICCMINPTEHLGPQESNGREALKVPIKCLGRVRATNVSIAAIESARQAGKPAATCLQHVATWFGHGTVKELIRSKRMIQKPRSS